MRVLMLWSLMLIGCNSVNAADAPAVSSGRIEHLSAFESRHVPARDVDVWLPDGYPQGKPYAVLYMHDGQMLFDASQTWNQQEWRVDEVASELIKAGQVRPFIVVGIANGGERRNSEYFPQKAFALLTPAKQEELLASGGKGQKTLAAGLAADAYLKFLTTELKPHVDRHYAVDKSRDSTAVLGSSMGGLISLYALVEYPDVFGAAAAMSTHWPGTHKANDPAVPDAMLAYLKSALPPPRTHRLYFDHGTATLDAWYPPLQQRVDALLRELGYDQRHWETREFAGAEHNEKAWAERLNVPLKFLFPPLDKAAEVDLIDDQQG